MKTKFNEFVNESYNISEDDYRYFRLLIEDDSVDKQTRIESIRSRRADWTRLMLASAKGHWGIGGGESEKFPRAEFLKVINDVLDEYVNEKIGQRKPLTFKSRNNELFNMTFKFDDKGRLDKVSNKWDVGYPDWWGLNISDQEIIEYFKKKHPEYYVVESINESTIPFDDDISNELRKLYKNTITEKTGAVEERIKSLLNLHSKWLETARKHYSAEDIANKLFKYDRDIHNGKV